MRMAGAPALPQVVGGTGVMFAEVLAWFGADLILAPSDFLAMGKIRRELPEAGDPTQRPLGE